MVGTKQYGSAPELPVMRQGLRRMIQSRGCAAWLLSLGIRSRTSQMSGRLMMITFKLIPCTVAADSAKRKRGVLEPYKVKC